MAEGGISSVLPCYCKKAAVNMARFTSKKFFAQIQITLLVGTALMVNGLVLSWTMPMVPQLTDREIPGYLTMNEMGWVASVIYLGMIWGPLLFGPLVDRLGRRLTLLLAVALCNVSYVICAIEPRNYLWLCVARFIAGLFCGVVFIVLPIYFGEIVEDENRGLMSSIPLVLFNISGLYCVVIGAKLDPRTFALASCVLIVLSCVCIFFIPETPHYLLECGNHKAAYESLRRLRANDDVAEELTRITKYVETRRDLSYGLMTFLTRRRYWKYNVICAMMSLTSAMSGFVYEQSYGALIFEEAGFELSNVACMTIFQTTLLLSSLSTTYFLHNYGRRQLWVAGVVATSAFLSVSAIYYNLRAIGRDVSDLAWIPLVSVIGGSCTAVIGIVTVSAVIVSEIFPMNVKASGNTVATLLNGLLTFGNVKFFQVIGTDYGHHVVLYVFAISTLVFGGILAILLPETKDKSFEEIENSINERSFSKFFRRSGQKDVPHVSL